MKKLISIAGLIFLLGLTGCKEVLTGSLVINTNLDYIDPNGSNQVLQAGKYSEKSSLSFFRDGVILEAYDENKDLKSWIKLRVPDALKKSNDIREFTLTPEELGQPFGLHVKSFIDTEVKGPFTNNVSCVYDSYYAPVCHKVAETHCYKNNHGHKHCHTVWKTICHNEIHYVYGRKWVISQDRIESRLLDIHFTSADKANVLGAFRHNDFLGTYKEILTSGPCLRF